MALVLAARLLRRLRPRARNGFVYQTGTPVKLDDGLQHLCQLASTGWLTACSDAELPSPFHRAKLPPL